MYGPSKDDDDDDDDDCWNAHTDTSMSMIMEWRDMELLPQQLKQQVKTLLKCSKNSLGNLPSPATTTTTTTTPKNDTDMANYSSIANRLFCSGESRTHCYGHIDSAHCSTRIVTKQFLNYQAHVLILHLTQRNRERLRKLRRQDHQRQQQDL